MAVVGVPVVLNGESVGAVVAGYHFLKYPEFSAIERFARQARLPNSRLWDVVRKVAPVSKQRATTQGELT
jgi:hypothetical protein